MLDGTRSEDNGWVWQQGQWRRVSEDGRYWWDGERWRPQAGPPPASEPARGMGGWVLVAIGAVLLLISLSRITIEIVGGLMNGSLDFALGRATVTVIFFVLPGVVLVWRGWTGRWL